MYFDRTVVQNFEGPEGLPIAPQDAKRTAEKRLDFRRDEEEPFYVAETDEDREKLVENMSFADAMELRHKAGQALRKAGGKSAVQITQSDWFQNKIPDKTELWPTYHPMSYEMAAFVCPIINANLPVSTDYLQDELQKKGAFLVRPEAIDDPKRNNLRFWKLIFFLDSKLYMDVIMDSPHGIPESVQLQIEIEEKKKRDAANKAKNLNSKDERARVVQEYEEQMILNNGKEPESDSEDDDEKIAKEEAEAKEAKFRISGFEAFVDSYRIYVTEEA